MTADAHQKSRAESSALTTRPSAEQQGAPTGGSSYGRGGGDSSAPDPGKLFAAEAAYAEGLFRQTVGDVTGAIAALESSLQALPSYAPALLGMGSVEYQRGNRPAAKRHFDTLLELPEDTVDLVEILDRAGNFLIDMDAYADGCEHYRRAVERFPQAACLHQGLGCCAGHLRDFALALTASRAALALEPDDQKLVTDLGWTRYLAGEIDEARETLARAVAMDPADELAANNLRVCNGELDPGLGQAGAPAPRGEGA
jgi:tetratricopeptide (TPR) repeat protein